MQPRTVIISPDALFQEVSGEGVILDLASSSYVGLDGVGVRFWQLLQLDPSFQQACDVLSEEYAVTAQQLESDLLHLVEQLSEAGLVTVA